jgi:hypothetical protein
MKKLIVLAGLALAACHDHPATPATQYIYCVTPEKYSELVKAEPAKVGGTLTGDARKDVKIEGASNVALRAYADGLLEVIGTCTGS